MRSPVPASRPALQTTSAVQTDGVTRFRCALAPRVPAEAGVPSRYPVVLAGGRRSKPLLQ